MKLRDRVTQLEALLAAAQDEIEERNEAILELNEALEVRVFLIDLDRVGNVGGRKKERENWEI